MGTHVTRLESLVAEMYDLVGEVRTENLGGGDLARLVTVVFDVGEYARDLACTVQVELGRVYPRRSVENGLSETRLELTGHALEVAAALAGDAVEAMERLSGQCAPVERTEPWP